MCQIVPAVDIEDFEDEERQDVDVSDGLIRYLNSSPIFNISDENFTFPFPSNLPSVVEPRVTNWFFFIINSIMILLILSGNSTTLWLMARYKRLRSVTNTFIISLACADLILGSVYPLYSILNYTTFAYSWTSLKYPCASCLYFIIVSAGVSNFSLLAVSVDRYYAVIHPLTYRTKVTYKRAHVCIVGIWIYILLVSLSMFPVYGQDLSKYYKISCSLLNLIPKWYFFGLIMPHMLIPNILSKLLYCKILYVARKQADKIYKENLRILGENGVRREDKATKTMAIILVFFILCWAPYTVLHIVIYSIGYSSPDWLYDMLEAAKVLSASNSVINPLVYVWRNRDFRQALKGCCHVTHNRVEPGDNISHSYSVSLQRQPFSVNAESQS